MSKASELYKRELERKANDEIKIHNPTSSDYFVKYGGYNWKVPATSDLIVPRYIATHYLKHMIDSLILKESTELIEREKKKYRGNFWPAEEERIALRTNNMDLRKKYIPQLWKGVVRKFGLDELPEEPQGTPDSTIPQDQQLLEELGLDEPVAQEEAQKTEESQVEEFAKAIAEEL